MIFLTCDVRLLVRKVCESNQADHVIGHLVHLYVLLYDSSDFFYTFYLSTRRFGNRIIFVLFSKQSNLSNRGVR